MVWRKSIILVLLLIIGVPVVLTSQMDVLSQVEDYGSKPFRITGMGMSDGTRATVMSPMDDWYSWDVICRLDTGLVDIVIVFDTTGSMYDDIANAQANVASFVNQLDAAGYDYALGLVTFGDGQRFSHGYDLTTNGTLFQSWIYALGASGGGDWRETALDGIVDAVNLYHWRPGALHVILMITDAPFHYRGESSYSSVTPAETRDLLVATGTVCFVVSPSTSSSPSIPSFDYNWYRTITGDSGGSWYLLGTSFSTIFADLVAMLSTFNMISISVTNTSGSTLNPVNVQLIPRSCITISGGLNPQSGGPVSSGSTIDFWWRVNIAEPCIPPEDCFEIRVWSGSYEDYIGGCWSIGEDCACLITVDAGPDRIICYPGSARLGGSPTALDGVEPYTYTWEPAEGLDNPNISNPIASPNRTTIYTVTVSDGINCTGSDQVIVTVSNPQSDAGPDHNVCIGERVVLGGAPTGSGGIPPLSYSWSPRDWLDDPTRPNPTATPERTTTYIITITDNIGCVTVDTVTVYVSNPQTDAGNDTVICRGECATLGGDPTITGGEEPIRYSWAPMATLDDPFNLNPRACPDTTTTYILSLTDAFGCTDADTVTVEVADHPYAEVIYPDSCGYITSCEDQYIVIRVLDSLRYLIDETAFRLQVEDLVYDIRTPELSWRPADLKFEPTTPWENWDTIEVTLLEYANIVGCYGDTVSCSFIVDLQPPIPSNAFPPNDTILHTQTTDICVDIYDSLAGLDTTSLEYASVTINSTSITGFTTSWDGSTFCFHDLPYFVNGDTVEVCLDSLYDAPDYDYCAPNDTFFCWRFIVLLDGPVASIIHPMPDSITACNPDTIVIRLAGTTAPVDESTIELNVDSVLYTIDHPWLTYDSAANSLIFAPPNPDFWADGDTVYVDLLRADDIYGSPLSETLSWYFYIDYRPPSIWNIFPPESSIVATPSPTIHFDIFDSVSGLSEGDMYITINDSMVFYIGDSATDWSGNRFTIYTTMAGIAFSDSDWVRVCVMDAWDMPDYCAPNDTFFCWDFVVSLSGPIGEIVDYFPNAYVACETTDQSIHMTLTDPDGVIPGSIIFQVEDSVYSVTDMELIFYSDTLAFFPIDYWEDNQSVDVCLLDATDSLGNHMSAPICWSFIMDLSPPYSWEENPPEGTILPPWASPVFSLHLHDTMAGIDPTTISINFCGIDYDTTSPALSWDGELLSFDPSVLSIDWFDCSPWCVYVSDLPDYCGPNDTVYCHTFYVTEGPHAEILEPLPGQISACDDQCIYVQLWDDDLPVDESTIILIVEGDTFYTADSELDYRNDSLIFCPDELWSNNQEVDVILLSADDSVGAHLIDTLTWSFWIDLEAPLVTNPDPAPGSIIGFLRPTICFDLTDNLSGVNWDSVRIQIDGVWYDTTSTEIEVTSSRICFHSDIADVDWEGGDEIEVCVHAIDSPDLCAPNVLDTCWSFIIEPGGPVGIILRPEDGVISACVGEHIVMYVLDDNGVDENTIRLMVSRYACTDSHTYSTADLELSFYDGDSLVFIPDRGFVDGELICVCLVEADDSLGNPLEEEVCWSFLMDLTPPVVWGEYPSFDDTIPSRIPVIYFSLYDSISGLDTLSVEVTIAGSTYIIPDTAMLWADPLMTWFPTLAGIEFHCGDSVEVCVHAEDSPTPGYCGPNILDTCWYFMIESGGPQADIVRPFDGAFSSCIDEHIEIFLWDSTGVDTNTIELIVNGASYFITSPELSYDPAAEMLYFMPDPPFPDSALIHVELVAADDILGCPLETPLDWSFIMDRIPPVMFDMNPDCGTTVYTTRPTISMIVIDSISGLNTDPDSLRLQVDGVWYDTTNAGVYLRGDTLVFSSTEVGVTFLGGYVVEVCLHAIDMIDYCSDNVLDTCCSFLISPGGPVGTILEPQPNTYSACDPEGIEMLVQDPDTVVDTTILFMVSRYACTDTNYYTVGDAELWYRNDTLFFQDDPTFEDGEVICAALLEAEDVLGNTLMEEVHWSFTMDLSPPVVNYQEPLPGEYVTDIDPLICVDIADSISGLNEGTIRLRINETSYGTSSPGMSWDGTRLCFDPAEVDTSWSGGDTVEVCIYAEDTPDYCDPNVLDSCWYFIVSPGGPIGTIIRPQPGVWSACEPESIIMTIIDPNGVIDATIRLVVSRYGCSVTDTYRVSDDELRFEYPTLVFFPEPYFENGETVCVSLIAADDSLGNPMGNAPVSWEFYMDLTPPIIWNESPQAGDVVGTITPTVSFQITDLLSGLDISSVVVTIGVNADVSPDSFRIGDPSITWTDSSSSLIWDPVAAGMEFSGGDLITVCVYAYDTPDSGYCAPNVLDTCWTFSVEPGGPIGTLLRPWNDTYSACVDDPVEHIEMYVEDDDGVVPNSIRLTVSRYGCRDSRTYGVETDTELSYRGDSLLFYPDPPFVDAETVCVCLDSADDYLGNHLRDVICWTFYMDLSTPVATFDQPGTGVGYVQSTQPIIVVSVDDSLSGVDESTIILEVEGVQYTIPPLHWSFNADGLGGVITFVPSEIPVSYVPGDTIDVCLIAGDSPFYCDPNILNTCWAFVIEPVVECYVHPNPFSPNTDTKNDYTIFDYPYEFTKKAELVVFTIRNVEVYRTDIGPISNFGEVNKRMWDGHDSDGKPCPDGIYIYVIQVDGKMVCNGTVILAR